MIQYKTWFKKHGARIGALGMCFMLLIPMLCSMASPTGDFEITVQNPDYIPHDYRIDYYTLQGGLDEEGVPLDFGINIAHGFLSNGFEDGEQFVPSGNYSMIYVVGTNLNGGTSLSCNGTPYNDNSLGVPCFVSDNPVITVTDDYSEDVSAFLIFVPVVTPTSSILSVWTGILNWGISALNSVQGLFYGSSDEIIAPDTSSSDIVVYNGTTYYPIDFLRAEEAGGVSAYLNGVEIFEDSYSQAPTVIDGVQYLMVSNGGTIILLHNTQTNATYSPLGLELIISNGGGLTLLGTLTVIGLAIAIAFLLIGIIQRFLRLRG